MDSDLSQIAEESQTKGLGDLDDQPPENQQFFRKSELVSILFEA